MPRSESDIQAAICKYLRRRPQCKPFPITVTAGSERGCPDILCAYRGQFVSFEVKQPWKSSTAIQKAQADQIREAGGWAFEVISVAHVTYCLDKVDKDLKTRKEKTCLPKKN